MCAHPYTLRAEVIPIFFSYRDGEGGGLGWGGGGGGMFRGQGYNYMLLLFNQEETNSEC